jgi:uncharacterized membrane protein
MGRSNQKSPLGWIIAMLIFAFIGFADAVYMSTVHFMGELPVCSVIEGCDVVAMSPYSTIGPIPVSLLGVLFYTLMLASGVFWIDTRKSSIFKYLPYITVPAFAFSAWLVYIMFFEIEALCIYCLVSAASTTLIMLISLWLRKFSTQTL